MKQDFFIKSTGIGNIHCRYWLPEGQAIGVIQIIHGIAEHVERYNGFAEYLNSLGYAVAAEDHMGHGQSINSGGVQGYFHGGWFAAVEDSYNLTKKIQQDFPEIPQIVFGHSMGSFMTRTLLIKHPDSGIAAAVICGTGWQPSAILPAGIGICKIACRKDGEKNPNAFLQNFIFGSYNKRVEHPRTEYDWLSRDKKSVDAYIADPLCGFIPTAGLLRDMLTGIQFIQKPNSLAEMNKKLPILFVAGEDDPVGSYGKGVSEAAEQFRKAGVEDVSIRLFPLGRHEILNEINKQEVYDFISRWIAKKTQHNQ